MRKYLLTLLLLLSSCGGSVKKEAEDTFEDLTRFTTINVINTGTVALSEIRFYHIDTGAFYYMGALFPITTVPPVPPLFAEIGPIYTGFYQIEMTHLGSGFVETIVREIPFGPVALELTPGTY
jgi:hypothetical protein